MSQKFEEIQLNEGVILTTGLHENLNWKERRHEENQVTWNNVENDEP